MTSDKNRATRRRTTHPRHPSSLLATRPRSAIKLFLCDVDGVLTDGSVFIGGAREFKRFNIRDGLGLVLLRRAGMKTGWVSGRPSAATAVRARELKIDFLVQQKDRSARSPRSKNFWRGQNRTGTRSVLSATTSWIWARWNAPAWRWRWPTPCAKRRRRRICHARGGRPRRGARSRGNDFEGAGKMGFDCGALPRMKAKSNNRPGWLLVSARGVVIWPPPAALAQPRHAGHATDFTSVEYYEPPHQQQIKSRSVRRRSAAAARRTAGDQTAQARNVRPERQTGNHRERAGMRL